MGQFSKAIIPGLILCFVLVLLGFIARLIGKSRQTGEGEAYEASDALLTPAERAFFGVLQEALASQFYLFAKVRIADIVQPAKRLAAQQRRSAFNRISAKHVDFVICELQTFRVVGAVELDDRSHNRSDRQTRDAFVDSIFNSVGIPIIRFPARQSYSAQQIRDTVETALHPSPELVQSK